MSNDPRGRAQALDWLRSGHLRTAGPMDDNEAARALAVRVSQAFEMFPEVEQLLYDLSIFRPPVNHALQGEAYLRYAQLRAGQDTVAAGFIHYLELATRLQGETHERSPDPASVFGGLDSLDPSGPNAAL